MTATAPSTALAPAVEYRPEDSPFQTVCIDITHRCNMACRNCYIPNRTIPDLRAEWVVGMMRRLPRGTFIRLIGAEPTLHPDLPLMIAEARRCKLHPVVVTNGLRLADRAYLRELKAAGAQIIVLSFSGGFDDDLYEAIDDLRCAEKKIAALENLRAEHMYTALGMIIVRGVNESEPANVLRYIQATRFVRELHLRSVGAVGRYMIEPAPLTLDELADVLARAGVDRSLIPRTATNDSHIEIRDRRVLRIQLTTWPELGSTRRGRLTPEGTVQPFFEHLMTNADGY
jgi:molybdenum cofactor biosynthesis enzyme MoaA